MTPLSAETPSTVLLIDDSISDMRLLMSMMLIRNYRVNVAFNGYDGYYKAELQQPDLILLDVNMPRQGGFTTCRLLKQNAFTRHIPVIFLTAMGGIQYRLDALGMGAVDFISKPFNEEEVLARVRIHLALAQAARPTPADCTTPATATGGTATAKPARNADQVRVAAAQETLRRHLADPPTPEALAKSLGTHEKRLNQAFQTCLGTTVFGWLREERLQQARHLLTSTQVPIASLSDVLGYSNPANFAKAFRERFGCSPRDARLGQAPV